MNTALPQHLFPTEIRTCGKGLRASLRTTTEALRLIDKELPAEVRGLPRWKFARALLVAAERSGKKRDVSTAFRQVKQALANDGWLAPEPEKAPAAPDAAAIAEPDVQDTPAPH